MKDIKKILVALDLSSADEKLLQYAKSVASVLRPEKVYFANVHAPVSIPDAISDQFPDIKEEIDERYVEEMVKEVSGVNIYHTEQQFCALEGDTLIQLIELVSKEEIDLVIVGKNPQKSKHNLPLRKLMRKVPTNVLVVPSETTPSFEKILVATDFSENSRLAIETAMAICEKSGSTLVCHHSYEVPTGYSKTGKSFTEFADIMKSHAINEAAEFLSPYLDKGVEIESSFSLNADRNPCENILGAAKDFEADLVIAGAKGMTSLAAVFLGSVAEGLIEHQTDVPVYIVKKEGHFYGLLDWIKSA